jgi:hypothetical protein
MLQLTLLYKLAGINHLCHSIWPTRVVLCGHNRLPVYSYLGSYLGKINVRVRRYAMLHKKYIIYGTKL